MSDFFGSRRVAVTGGAGFLGRVVVRELGRAGCGEPFVPRSREYDLRRGDGVRAFLRDARPDLVIHLAGSVGGIGANRANPGSFLYDNLTMGSRLIDECRKAGVGKFVCVGTVCAYPAQTPVPFREDDIWAGYPEPTNAPYGLAKKMLLVQLQAYRRQYGFNGIYLLPANLYGPEDDFDLETSHVIPALIRKCIEARERNEARIVGWGSGKPTREFLYVDDCARAIVLAAELHDDADPINIGTGQEISIAKVAALIAERTKFTGELVWDETMPDGQLRRRLDVSRATDKLGFSASTTLEEGLDRAIEWYERERRNRSAS